MPIKFGKVLILTLLFLSKTLIPAVSIIPKKTHCALLVKAQERGINFNASIGIHGSSALALEQAAVTGYWPADEGTESGLIYFFPNLDHQKIKPLIGKDFQVEDYPLVLPKSYDQESPENWVSGYAGQHSQTLRILLTLGLAPNSENYNMARYFAAGDGNAERYFIDMGFLPDEIYEARQSLKPKIEGVIATFKPSILKEFLPKNTQVNNDGLFFEVPKPGIPIRYLQGLLLRGSYDKQVLTNLEKGKLSLLSRKAKRIASQATRIKQFIRNKEWELLWAFINSRNVTDEEKIALLNSATAQMNEPTTVIRFVEHIYDQWNEPMKKLLQRCPATQKALRAIH